MYTRVIIFIIKETEKVLVFIILSPLKYQVGFHPKTYFHMLKDHHCYDHKDLHLSQVKKKKYESEMVCFFFGVNILNSRTNITWPLGGMKFLLLLVLKITLCISLDCKHLKRNFVPTCYHVISSMYLGHEDI